MIERAGRVCSIAVEGDRAMVEERVRPKRNWWKVAFFVAIVAFELAREVAVLESATGAEPNTRFAMFNFRGEHVTAEGSWRRTDGKGQLVPTVTKIVCRKELNECFEATSNIIDNSVFPPDVDFFQAQFGPDSVSYTNDSPTCVQYAVRLDLKMEQVLANRKRKSTAGDCANAEPLITMRLGDGKESDDYGREINEHFVPIIILLAAVL